MALASMVLSFAGFAALACSMTKHHRDLFGKGPSQERERALRLAGWMLLTLSVTPAIVQSGMSIGIVLWFGILTVAAVLVALLLTYRSLG